MLESRALANSIATSYAQSLEKQLSRSLSSTHALATVVKREFESRALAISIATSYAQFLKNQILGSLPSTSPKTPSLPSTEKQISGSLPSTSPKTPSLPSTEKQISGSLPSTSPKTPVEEQNKTLVNFDSLAKELIDHYGQNKTLVNFDSLAKELIDHYGGIINMQLAPNGIVKQISPLEGYQKALGQDLNKNPYARLAIQSKELTLEGPIELAQGGVAVLGRYPVYLPNLETGEEEFWGFSIA